jgi:signal transduction histidine kinase
VSDTGTGDRLQEVVDRLQSELEELRRSRRRLVEVAHADRRAIERDLHDGVQQHLVALAVDLRRLAGLVDGASVAATSLIDDLTANVQEALDQSTELAQKVYPSLLDGRGLASAIRSAASRLGITVLVDAPARTGYPPDVTAAVYWSCLDALTSASPGSTATVSVFDADGALTFEIGITGHFGGDYLERLRDRIEALDGRVTFDDPTNRGTLLHGRLPVSG